MKAATILKYSERFDMLIDHIEKNIQDNTQLSSRRLEEIVGYDSKTVNRIVGANGRDSISNLIKQIRLEKAAWHLRNSSFQIADIGVMYNFNDKSDFSNAFKNHFGKSPSDYRKTPCNPKPFLLKEHTIIVNPEKRNLGNIKLLYVREQGGYSTDAPEAAWDTLLNYIELNKIDITGLYNFGIIEDDPDITVSNYQRYKACVQVKGKMNPGGKVRYQELDSCMYFVFKYVGAYFEINSIYHQIYGTWLMNNPKVKLSSKPVLEMYLNNIKNTEPENLITEIYIPIED